MKIIKITPLIISIIIIFSALYCKEETGEEPDTKPPTIVGTFPTDGCQIEYNDVRYLQVAFSEKMKQDVGLLEIVGGSTTITVGTPAWLLDEKTYRVDINSTVEENVEYTVNIIDFKDLAGNTYSHSSSNYTFTTIPKAVCTETPEPADDFYTIITYPNEEVTIVDEIPLATHCVITDTCEHNSEIPLSFDTTGNYDYSIEITCASEVFYQTVRIKVENPPSPVPVTGFLEQFTGAACEPCAVGDSAMQETFNHHAADSGFIAWHISIPAYDEWSFQAFTQTTETPEWDRLNGYLPLDDECCFAPFVIIGGKTFTFASDSKTNLTTFIDNAPEPEIIIRVKGVFYSNQAKIIYVINNFSENPISDYYYNIIINENNVENKTGYVSYDTYGILEFDHVARQFVTNAESITIQPGRNIFTKTVELSDFWYETPSQPANAQDLEVVIWLQKEVDKDIDPSNEDDQVPLDLGGGDVRTIYTRDVHQTGFTQLIYMD
jgi:hypothetical protein